MTEAQTGEVLDEIDQLRQASVAFALAEVGDKTQLLSLLLAARFRQLGFVVYSTALYRPGLDDLLPSLPHLNPLPRT